MIKHSPGNWSLNARKDAVITDAHSETNSGNIICVSPARDEFGQAIFNHSEPFWLENAKLISRAPELLKQNIELIDVLKMIVSKTKKVDSTNTFDKEISDILHFIRITVEKTLKDCHNNRFLTTD